MWHKLFEWEEMGGDGGVVGGSNIFPEAFVSFYQGAVPGNETMENGALQKIQALKAIYDLANGRFVQATGTSLCVLGISQESFALPLLPFTEEERSLVKKVVGEIKAMD